MYEAADHSTGKPLVFCERCEKQLMHTNNNNMSGSALVPTFSPSLIEETPLTSDFFTAKPRVLGEWVYWDYYFTI
jgi:hypothetical protein